MTGMPTADMTLVALRDMREFFSDPNHWLQGEAKDGSGRYCMVGYAGDHWHSYVRWFLDRCARNEIGDSEPGDMCETARFNDEHTHAEVLAFLDRAIAAYTAKTVC